MLTYHATASTLIGWHPNVTALAAIHKAIFDGGETFGMVAAADDDDDGGGDCPCAEAKPCAAARQTCSTSLCPTSTAPMTTAAWSRTLAVTIVRGETPHTIISAILRRLLVGSYTPMRVPSRNTLGVYARKEGARVMPGECACEWEWAWLEVCMQVCFVCCCVCRVWCVCCWCVCRVCRVCRVLRVCCVCCVERAPRPQTHHARFSSENE